MSTQNVNRARDPDIEQDAEDNVKVVPAKKGTKNAGFGGDRISMLYDGSGSAWEPSPMFGSPDVRKSDLSRQLELRNEHDSGKEPVAQKRGFSPSASAFRPAESVFSKTPGPGSKPTKTHYEPIDLQTPSKSVKGTLRVETPSSEVIQGFQLFDGDDHTWTQARNTFQAPARSTSETSMTPLMNSMLGPLFESSPVPNGKNNA